MCPLPLAGEASSAGQLNGLGEGEFAIPHPAVFADRQAPPSPARGEGATTSARIFRAVRSVAGLRELAQIGRRLVLARRHQVAILPNEIGLLLEDDDRVVLMTEVFGPGGLGDASERPRHRPWTGQGVV